jgi:undecaprenyl-phosphate 4-deoxy-4-formamido-L-arabinose transferase
VDDGSRDGSFAVLRELHGQDPCLRVLRLARNFGQNPALYAGFAHARGRVVVTLDADLQNPPSEIPKLVEKLDEGFDMVQGWRKDRRDSLFRRLASRTINKVVSFLTRVEIHDLGSGLKAYRREVVERMSDARHHCRYIPAETAWHGLSIGEVEVAHRDRAAGETKYGIFALLRVNFDMIASISAAPVHLIGILGALCSLAGFAMAARVLYVRIAVGDINQLGTVLALVFVLNGVTLTCISILCEYISRIYIEVQGRPYFIVGEKLE